MSRNPFQLKIGKPVDVSWSAGQILDFDQSSADPRFSRNEVEEGRKQYRFVYLITAMCVVFALLLLRLVSMQLIHFPEYLAMAEGNRLRVQELLAPRGLMYDRYSEVIVRNEPSFELVFSPPDLPRDSGERERLVSTIADFFRIDRVQLQELVVGTDLNSFLPVSVEQGISQERAVVFLAQQEKFPGFSVQNNPQRNYPDGPMFSHVVGYTGKLRSGEYEKLKSEGYVYNDVIGKSGLETVYESYLRGVLGQRLVEVDAKGVVKNTFQEKKPLPGGDLHLNLDAELQRVLYNSMQAQLVAHRATRAAAVALDPKTGGVLALVSLPGFDNNWFAEGISDVQYQSLLTDQRLPLFNRVTLGTYPPGSTVKPMLAVAALQEGIVDVDTKIWDRGQLVVPNQFDPSIVYTFRGWKPGGLGPVNVHQAIAESSDIYFYTIGGGQQELKIEGLGAERLAEYMKKFFLGELTGIDLPTERPGLVPTPDWKAQHFAGNPIDEKWFLGDTYNMSIGQGFVLVTPLQLAVATAAVANGGTVYKPQLVSFITDRSGKTVKVFDPVTLRSDIVDRKYLEESRLGMRLAVTEGTARLLSGIPLSIAGKTGTSQFDGSDLSRTHAWFTAFAPYENPEIVLTVLIEAGGEGSSAAVPVARDVFNWYSTNRK